MAGYALEGQEGGKCLQDINHKNSLLTFPVNTAKALSADYKIIALTGRGVYRCDAHGPMRLISTLTSIACLLSLLFMGSS